MSNTPENVEAGPNQLLNRVLKPGGRIRQPMPLNATNRMVIPIGWFVN
jgi:hypothetical protein